MRQRSICRLWRPPFFSTARGSRGFALITTIWGLGLIALLATAVIIGARYRTAGASNMAATTRASLAAESAVNLAIVLLVQQPQAFQAVLARFPLRCKLPGGEDAVIVVEDEAGKIDLNAASPQLLSLFFSRLTGDQAKGALLANRVVEFRQATARPPQNASTSPSANATVFKVSNPLQGANQETKPNATGFVSILQLDQAADISPSLFRATLPFITVRSGQPTVSPDAASRRLRQLLNIASGSTTPEFKTPSGLNVTIRADVAAPNGARFVREALVSFGSGIRPFDIHEWRHGDVDASLEPVHIATAAPNCFRTSKDADVPTLTKYWN